MFRNLTKCNKITVGTYLAVLMILLSACGGNATVNAPAENTPQIEPTAPPVEELSTEGPEAAPEEEITSVDSNIFMLVSGETEARFVIDEVLFGQKNTVVGITNQVTGEIRADYGDAQNAQVMMNIDLSTLVTDSNRRNTTIKNNILESNKPLYQFGQFISTELFGLPESVEVGASYKVQITGDLTVHGNTHEVVFEGSITVESETRMSGSFEAIILYTDYVSVFRLPQSVASVEEEVVLQIDFVAEKP